MVYPTYHHHIYIYQWPFQEPKLEVPNIYKAYFWGLDVREYPHNFYGQTYMVLTYLHLLDPEDLPLIGGLTIIYPIKNPIKIP